MATLWNGNFFYNMCKGTNEKLKMWTDEVWKINETLTEYNQCIITKIQLMVGRNRRITFFIWFWSQGVNIIFYSIFGFNCITT